MVEKKPVIDVNQKTVEAPLICSIFVRDDHPSALDDKRPLFQLQDLTSQVADDKTLYNEADVRWKKPEDVTESQTDPQLRDLAQALHTAQNAYDLTAKEAEDMICQAYRQLRDPANKEGTLNIQASAQKPVGRSAVDREAFVSYRKPILQQINGSAGLQLQVSLETFKYLKDVELKEEQWPGVWLLVYEQVTFNAIKLAVAKADAKLPAGFDIEGQHKQFVEEIKSPISKGMRPPNYEWGPNDEAMYKSWTKKYKLTYALTLEQVAPNKDKVVREQFAAIMTNPLLDVDQSPWFQWTLNGSTELAYEPVTSAEQYQASISQAISVIAASAEQVLKAHKLAQQLAGPKSTTRFLPVLMRVFNVCFPECTKALRRLGEMTEHAEEMIDAIEETSNMNNVQQAIALLNQHLEHLEEDRQNKLAVYEQIMRDIKTLPERLQNEWLEQLKGCLQTFLKRASSASESPSEYGTSEEQRSDSKSNSVLYSPSARKGDLNKAQVNAEPTNLDVSMVNDEEEIKNEPKRSDSAIGVELASRTQDAIIRAQNAVSEVQRQLTLNNAAQGQAFAPQQRQFDESAVYLPQAIQRGLLSAQDDKYVITDMYKSISDLFINNLHAGSGSEIEEAKKYAIMINSGVSGSQMYKVLARNFCVGSPDESAFFDKFIAACNKTSADAHAALNLCMAMYLVKEKAIKTVEKGLDNDQAVEFHQGTTKFKPGFMLQKELDLTMAGFASCAQMVRNAFWTGNTYTSPIEEAQGSLVSFKQVQKDVSLYRNLRMIKTQEYTVPKPLKPLSFQPSRNLGLKKNFVPLQALVFTAQSLEDLFNAEPSRLMTSLMTLDQVYFLAYAACPAKLNGFYFPGKHFQQRQNLAEQRLEIATRVSHSITHEPPGPTGEISIKMEMTHSKQQEEQKQKLASQLTDLDTIGSLASSGVFPRIMCRYSEHWLNTFPSQFEALKNCDGENGQNFSLLLPQLFFGSGESILFFSDAEEMVRNYMFRFSSTLLAQLQKANPKTSSYIEVLKNSDHMIIQRSKFDKALSKLCTLIDKIVEAIQDPKARCALAFAAAQEVNFYAIRQMMALMFGLTTTQPSRLGVMTMLRLVSLGTSLHTAINSKLFKDLVDTIKVRALEAGKEDFSERLEKWKNRIVGLKPAKPRTLEARGKKSVQEAAKKATSPQRTGDKQNPSKHTSQFAKAMLLELTYQILKALGCTIESEEDLKKGSAYQLIMEKGYGCTIKEKMDQDKLKPDEIEIIEPKPEPASMTQTIDSCRFQSYDMMQFEKDSLKAQESKALFIQFCKDFIKNSEPFKKEEANKLRDKYDLCKKKANLGANTGVIRASYADIEIDPLSSSEQPDRFASISDILWASNAKHLKRLLCCHPTGITAEELSGSTLHDKYEFCLKFSNQVDETNLEDVMKIMKPRMVSDDNEDVDMA